MSYKPETNVIEAAQGLLLAQALVAESIPVVAYDPAAIDGARHILGESVRFSETAEDCIQKSDLVVIVTPWKQFGTIAPKSFAPAGSRVLIDCWRILDGSRFEKVTDYIALGVGPRAGST